MNRSLISCFRSSILLKKTLNSTSYLIRPISTTVKVNGGHFPKDVKPGPYPVTKEERIAAAKKYGLNPEDYEPYPDDGFGYGDYPKLAELSSDMKNPYNDYDDPLLRRNFGEPIHIFQEFLTQDKITLDDGGISNWHKLGVLLLITGIFFSLSFATANYRFFTPVLPRQLPRNVEQGEKHYKFD